MTVKQKQLILCWFDFLPVSGVDGIWGPQSEGAARSLQRKLGISETGNFDQNTEGEVLSAMVNGWEPETDSADDPDNGTEDSANENAAADNKTGTFWEGIKYFTREEFRCQCYKQVARYGGPYCDGFPVEPDETLLLVLDEIRRRAGVPIRIVDAGGSGIRCQQHNAHVGGVENSEHKYGRAADLHPDGMTPAKLYAIAVEVCAEMIPGRGGIGLYDWGVHVDVGKYSRWNG